MERIKFHRHPEECLVSSCLLFILTGSAKTEVVFIKDPKLDIFTVLAFVFHRLCQGTELHNE